MLPLKNPYQFFYGKVSIICEGSYSLSFFFRKIGVLHWPINQFKNILLHLNQKNFQIRVTHRTFPGRFNFKRWKLTKYSIFFCKGVMSRPFSKTLISGSERTLVLKLNTVSVQKYLVSLSHWDIFSVVSWLVSQVSWSSPKFQISLYILRKTKQNFQTPLSQRNSKRWPSPYKYYFNHIKV